MAGAGEAARGGGAGSRGIIAGTRRRGDGSDAVAGRGRDGRTVISAVAAWRGTGTRAGSGEWGGASERGSPEIQGGRCGMAADQAIQFSLLGLTGVLFAAAFVLGLRHMRRATVMEGAVRLPHETTMGKAARGVIVMATAAGSGVADLANGGDGGRSTHGRSHSC